MTARQVLGKDTSVSEEDVMSRREAEAFERQGDELIKSGAQEQAREYYRHSQKILLPGNKMWSDAVEYDLRMEGFQRIQKKLWALAEGGAVKVGVPGPAPVKGTKPPELPAPPPKYGTSEAARKFEASMIIDYYKWHDGEGYDLEALAQMTPDERAAAAKDLKSRATRGEAAWRDTEALAALGGDDAKEALQKVMKTGELEAQLHAARELDDLGIKVDMPEIIRKVLERGGFAQGVSMAFSLAPEHDSKRMREIVLTCARTGAREVRVHAAALCFYFAHLTDEEFDWKHRPFFLEFGEEDPANLRRVWTELKTKLEAAPGWKFSAKTSRRNN